MKYEAVIGLEVHAQLKTDSKLFCACSTMFGALPNSQICPVCTGQPGVLPVTNEKAVQLVIKTGLALDSTVNSFSRFARKQYFYPDLPKNYQISQFDTPLCIGGSVLIEPDIGKKRLISLTRIHLEEDAGKLLHKIGSRMIDGSLVDFNRTGIPLMEIVSEPDINSADEAYAYLAALKEILEYLGVSDCNMEEGKLRCDANISLRLRGEKKLGTKTELKNINSFKNVRDGIEYEIIRQQEILLSGGRIMQETRLWDAEHMISKSMRSKEESHDYRYFSEPDLAPLVLSDEYIRKIKEELPVLPAKQRMIFEDTYSLSSYDAKVLAQDKKLAEYFECTVQSACGTAKTDVDILKSIAKYSANWISTELLGRLNADGFSISDSPVSAAHLGRLVFLINSGTISGKIGKTVFEEMFKNNIDPEIYVQQKGLLQITNEDELSAIIEEVIAENKKAVIEYKNGKAQALGALVGRVMKKTDGRANPPLVNKILKKKLIT